MAIMWTACRLYSIVCSLARSSPLETLFSSFLVSLVWFGPEWHELVYLCIYFSVCVFFCIFLLFMLPVHRIHAENTHSAFQDREFGVELFYCLLHWARLPVEANERSFVLFYFRVWSGLVSSRLVPQDFPEHRLKFFRLLKAVNTYCFGTLFEIPPEHQKLVVDSVVWAFKHTERNIGGSGYAHRIKHGTTHDACIFSYVEGSVVSF